MSKDDNDDSRVGPRDAGSGAAVLSDAPDFLGTYHVRSPGVHIVLDGRTVTYAGAD